MKFSTLALALPALVAAVALPEHGLDARACSKADSYCCRTVAPLDSSWDFYLETLGITVNTNNTKTLGIGCALSGNGTCFSSAPLTCCTGLTFTTFIGGIATTNCTRE